VCATRCRLVVAQYHGSSRVGSFTSSRVNFLLLSVPVGPIMPLPGDNVHFPPWDTLTSSPAPHVALVGVTRRTYYVLPLVCWSTPIQRKKTSPPHQIRSVFLQLEAGQAMQAAGLPCLCY
jgi:hypothetical protein